MKKLNMFDYEKEIKTVSLAIIWYLLSSCDQLIGIFPLAIIRYLLSSSDQLNGIFFKIVYLAHIQL